MRIAICDDRPLAVEAVRRVLAREPGYRVAWVAYSGEEAVRHAAIDKPDLLLLDLVMPAMTGAEAARRIMASAPCPILVVTATVSGNFGLVYEALGAGAIDAVNTPTLGTDGSTAGGDELLAKIAAVARKLKGSGSAILPALKKGPHLFAVGASTGGPAAVADTLAAIPADAPVAGIVVVHISPEFTAGLADWLATKVKLPVRVARSGDAPTAGLVLVAGRGDHLVMTTDGTLAYTPHPAAEAFRPNIDVLFRSLAAHWPTPGSAAVLTGMQRDGASGLLALRRAGWATYAQSAGTCVVESMPDAAVRLGAAAHVYSPSEIGTAVAAAARLR